MHPILFWYIFGSLCLSSVVYTLALLHDVYARFFNPEAKDPKFGYNITSQLTYIFVIGMLPFVNIATLVFIVSQWRYR